MIVNLFHTIRGEDRVSMEVYANSLGRALVNLSAPGLDVKHTYPRNWFHRHEERARSHQRLAAIVDRYGVYQLQSLAARGDVCHIVDHGYAHLTLSLRPRRCVVTFHDAVLLKLRARELPGTEFYPMMTMLGHDLSLQALRGVERVITDSESSKRDLIRFTGYPPERTRVIPLGVSESFAPAPDLKKQTAPGHTVRLLHVGHCGPYKNIESILIVLPRIAAALQCPVQLLKVGGDFTQPQRELIIRLRVADMIKHLGRVRDAELPGIYREADLLLMPSRYEGFGLPVLEAMACGLPVVTSNAGSLPEVVGEAGVMTDPNDIDGMVAAVVRILTDACFAAQLRASGLAWCRQFTWERTARETLAVYRQIAEA